MLPLVGEVRPSAPGAASALTPAPAPGCGVSGVHPGERSAQRWLGVVLCGGASRRMGRDKASLELAGEPFYVRVALVLDELCAEVVLASGPTARLCDPRWREVPDVSLVAQGVKDERQGPLAALVAGLALAAREGFDGVLVAPCDVPRLSAAALAPLQRAVAGPVGGAQQRAHSATPDVAHWRRGERDEPLCAALSVRALPALTAAFERGVRRPTEAYAALRVEVREAPAALAESLTNVNTPEELARLGASTGARSRLESSPAGDPQRPADGDQRMGDVA